MTIKFDQSDIRQLKTWFPSRLPHFRDDFKALGDATDDAAAFATLETWAGALTGDAAVVLPAGTYGATADVTIPVNVTLHMEPGAIISVPTGVTLTVLGAIKAGPYQIFDGDGTVDGPAKVDAVYPEWFGARAPAETNDTTAIVKAVAFAAGQEVVFTQPLYPVRNMAFTDVPIIRLRGLHGTTIQHLYDGVLYDETMLTITSPSRVEFHGLTFDCNETCARCVNIEQLTPFADADEHRAVVSQDCHFRNGKQWLEGTYPVGGTDRAIGLRVQGYFTTADVTGGEVVNFTSVQPVVYDPDTGEQIKGPIARGILFARNPTGGYVKTARVDDVFIDTIGPANDGDGIQYISDDPPTDGTLIVTRCRSRNAAKRFAKAQGAHAIIVNNTIYRDEPPYLLGNEDEEGPGVEIAILRGGGIVTDNIAYYEVGCAPPMFVSSNSLIDSPTFVGFNTVDSADPDEIMERFVGINAVNPVQNGVDVYRNTVNMQLNYLARIRPDAQPSGGTYSVDRLTIEKNYARSINRGLVSLERSGSGHAEVRGAIRGNEHDGAVVPAVIFRYTNVAFDLTDWKDNRNIRFFSQRENTDDNSALTTSDWETLTGYTYSGDEYEVDFRPAQTLTYNRITRDISSVGDVRFQGVHRGNEAITCVLEHSGKGTFFITCMFHPGGGTAFADNAACCNFRVQHGTTPQALQRLNSTYSGSWDVFDTGPTTIEIRKAPGTGSSSAEWWVDVVGTARPREG